MYSIEGEQGDRSNRMPLGVLMAHQSLEVRRQGCEIWRSLSTRERLDHPLVIHSPTSLALRVLYHVVVQVEANAGAFTSDYKEIVDASTIGVRFDLLDESGGYTFRKRRAFFNILHEAIQSTSARLQTKPPASFMNGERNIRVQVPTHTGLIAVDIEFCDVYSRPTGEAQPVPQHKMTCCRVTLPFRIHEEDQDVSTSLAP